MLKKIIGLVKMNSDQYNRISKQNSEIIRQNREIILQNQELIWANIFHDSIKGKLALEELPLNIGRWAGNYTLFYILFRILNDFKPKRILELGLGESSKFISVFIDNYLKGGSHTIIEHDSEWKRNFLNKFDLSGNSRIILSPIKLEKVKEKEVKTYSSLKEIEKQKFDFYFIDGPNGSLNYSRYDAFKLTDRINSEDDFIMMIDDYDREGEKATVELIFNELDRKKIEYVQAEYSGVKSIIVIASPKYKAIQNL